MMGLGRKAMMKDGLLVFDEFDRDACPWIRSRSLERSMIDSTIAV
jgi:hypothetical protein